MKVKIKDLEPNPYRDIENYPIDEDKVTALIDSIGQTGFWDNILARKKDGKFQLAYGHHRLAALKQVFHPTHEVDIPIKDLPDAIMIQVMANENLDDWRVSAKVIDETVKVTKQYLEQHPEETPTLAHGRGLGGEVGSTIISKFLGKRWSERMVSYSLERLKAFMDEQAPVSKEAAYTIPSEHATREFVRAVKKHKIPIAKQQGLAKEIIESNRFGARDIEDVIVASKYKQPKRKEVTNEKIIKYESYVAEIRNKADDVLQDLKKMVVTERVLGDVENNPYRKLLLMSLKSLCEQVQLIINKKEDEKSKSTNASIRSLTE